MSDYEEVDLSRFDSDTIDKAFWLQEHIRRHGVEGINYMFHARTHARTRGPREVADQIDREISRL